MGFADEAPGYDEAQAERRQPEPVEHDPTEYIPVMRHHLMTLGWALNLALSYQEALDLAESYRAGLSVPKHSPLCRSLQRELDILRGYLGLRDEEESDEDAPQA